MTKVLTADDVKNARRQATAAARTPLLAVLGAGEAASAAVRDYLAKPRTAASDQAKDVPARVHDMQIKLAELPHRLTEVPTRVRTTVDDLPGEFAEWRGKLEPSELRHVLENYLRSLQALYGRLADRGETTAAKLRENPQVRNVLDRVEEAAYTTEDRIAKFVEEAGELTVEVLTWLSRGTRPAGEKHAIQPAASQPAGEPVAAGETSGDAAGVDTGDNR